MALMKELNNKIKISDTTRKTQFLVTTDFKLKYTFEINYIFI